MSWLLKQLCSRAAPGGDGATTAPARRAAQTSPECQPPAPRCPAPACRYRCDENAGTGVVAEADEPSTCVYTLTVDAQWACAAGPTPP